jgi:hypothetical protein
MQKNIKIKFHILSPQFMKKIYSQLSYFYLYTVISSKYFIYYLCIMYTIVLFQCPNNIYNFVPIVQLGTRFYILILIYEIIDFLK